MHDNHKDASGDDIYRLMMRSPPGAFKICQFRSPTSIYWISWSRWPCWPQAALETRVGGALLTHRGASSLLISPRCRYWKPHSGGTAWFTFILSSFLSASWLFYKEVSEGRFHKARLMFANWKLCHLSSSNAWPNCRNRVPKITL